MEGVPALLGHSEVEGSITMAVLNNPENVTTTVTASDYSTASSSSFFTACSESIMVEGTQSGNCTTSIEDQIQRFNSHWSQVVEFDSDDEEMVEISNMQSFRALQRHPKWGVFFWTYNKDKLMMGEKFAEGGQAEIYEAKFKVLGKEPAEVVLKVFKKGTKLQQLQSQWPLGFLQYTAMEYAKFNIHAIPRAPERQLTTMACSATLLDDGRFAFLLRREKGDLRTEIDCMMSSGNWRQPFSNRSTEVTMYIIAKAMYWLHNKNILHRDLKASNVLVSLKDHDGLSTCYVADFECSNGVVGTGFFRAPEILQACKDGNVNQRPELFTKAADVYSYGMTCYEILTGKLPFESYSLKDYDVVLNGHRPEIPTHVDAWIRELLDRCWHPNPVARPLFDDILKIFAANTTLVYEDRLVDVQFWKETRKKGKYLMT